MPVTRAVVEALKGVDVGLYKTEGSKDRVRTNPTVKKKTRRKGRVSWGNGVPVPVTRADVVL